MRSQRAKILHSRLVYSGKIFNVRRERVSEPDGVICTREVVIHSGSVVVLPVFDDGSILLVRQYRHAARRFLWELVAGRIESGESPAAAARRELAEEAGYTARRLQKLLDFFPTPGLMSERMWVLAATGLTGGAAHPEEDERIVSRRFSWPTLERMMRRGTLQDGKTIAGLLFYAHFAR